MKSRGRGEWNLSAEAHADTYRRSQQRYCVRTHAASESGGSQLQPFDTTMLTVNPKRSNLALDGVSTELSAARPCLNMCRIHMFMSSHVHVLHWLLYVGGCAFSAGLVLCCVCVCGGGEVSQSAVRNVWD